MVVNDNHDEEAHSSSSGTCLPAGFKENATEETGFDDGEEAQEVDFATVPPTPNVSVSNQVPL
jgi:hypothetical protein